MFENKNKWPLEHWHIEISSRCTLQCPRCTRQEVPDGLVNTDLRLQWFKDNFNVMIHKAKKITFCGDDGDPIYARDFLDVCDWMKQKNPAVQLVVVTNGSGKKVDWWERFSQIFDHNDHIHFSIDGDEHTNELYRINADWHSIMAGIDTLNKKDCKVFKTWACIAFKFNFENIDIIKDIATQKQFDYFQLTKSSKFGSNYGTYPADDPLEPDAQYVSSGRFTRHIDHISARQWKDNVVHLHEQRFKSQKSLGDIQPLCYVGNKGLYINSQGKFFPCCWTGLRYGHNKGIFDYIDQDRPLHDVLNDPAWNTFNKSLEDGSCPRECKEKCTFKKWSYEHATQW